MAPSACHRGGLRGCAALVPATNTSGPCWGVTWATFTPHIYIAFGSCVVAIMLGSLNPLWESYLLTHHVHAESWIFTYIGTKNESPRKESFLQIMYIIQFWLSGSECYYWTIKTYTHQARVTTDAWEAWSISFFTVLWLVNAMKGMLVERCFHAGLTPFNSDSTPLKATSIASSSTAGIATRSASPPAALAAYAALALSHTYTTGRL